MAGRTYWEFFPSEMKLTIVEGAGGGASKGEMYLKTIGGADVNVVLDRPRLGSRTYRDLAEMSGDLGEVAEVQCRREHREGGGLRCRVEIVWEGGRREFVGCREIEGLPE